MSAGQVLPPELDVDDVEEDEELLEDELLELELELEDELLELELEDELVWSSQLPTNSHA